MTVKWIGPGFLVQSQLREGGRLYDFADHVAEELIGRGLCVKVEPDPLPEAEAETPKPTPRVSRLRVAEKARGEE